MMVDEFLQNVGKLSVAEVLEVPEGTILVVKVPEEAAEKDFAKIQINLHKILPSSVKALITNYDLDISVMEIEEAEELLDQLTQILEESEED